MYKSLARQQIELEQIHKDFKSKVKYILNPLISQYYPELVKNRENELKKMLELSTKMMIVGKACTEIAGVTFDERHEFISALFGGCSFISDSFIDDFGEKKAREYLKRLEVLLKRGWFEIRNDREKLFYVIITRLFLERDVSDHILRQTMMSLFAAQKRDVTLRLNPLTFSKLDRKSRLRVLRRCARDRSGHAILVLTHFLVPFINLRMFYCLYLAGELISNIDDYGDIYSDLRFDRITYMNQLKNPKLILSNIFKRTISQLYNDLPDNNGRDLMIAFLYRYFTTRLIKKEMEKDSRELKWTVYE
jgi:hypothetical protein